MTHRRENPRLDSDVGIHGIVGQRKRRKQDYVLYPNHSSDNPMNPSHSWSWFRFGGAAWLAVTVALPAFANPSGGGPPGASASAPQPTGGAGGSYVLPLCDQPRELTLQQVVQQMLRNSPTVLQSRERMRQQGNSHYQAWSAWSPKLRATAKQSHTLPVPEEPPAGTTGTPAAAPARPSQTADATFSVSVPLFQPGAAAQLRSTRLQERAGKHLLRHDRATAVLNAVQGYYTVVMRAEHVRQARQLVTRATAHEQFVNERMMHGLVKTLDRTRVLLELQRAQDTLRQAQLQEQFAIGQLGVLIGAQCAFAVVKPKDDVGTQDLPPDTQTRELTHKALHVRQDLQAQQLTLLASRASCSSAWLALLPRVELAGQAQYTTNPLGSSQEHWGGAVMIQGTWDLDVIGRHAQMRQVASALRGERIKTELLRRQVPARVRGRLKELEVKRQSVVTLRRGLELATQLQEDTDLLYRQGSDSVTMKDVVDADYKAFEARTQLTKAELELRIMRAKLLHARGLLEPATLMAPVPPAIVAHPEE
ncbi:MAG: TolC family protein [Myxococcota bacterium]